MSKVIRKITLYFLSASFMLCMVLGGVFFAKINAKAETTTVNLTYKSMQYQNNEENAGSYWTSICFNPDTGDGVSTGNPNGAIAADFSNLLANTVYNGSDNTVIYTPACHWGWTMDFKSSTFCFVYLRTINMPTAGDTVQMKKGAWFVTGGAIDDKYVLAEDINLKFNGTVWEYFIPPVETTPVTFSHINSSWNDNTQTLNNGMHYTVLHLSGLLTSGYFTQGDDWTDMMANATINGGASYFNFCPASYIAGPNVASNFIILFSAQAPAQGDVFLVKAGATFDVGGDDNHLYELTDDICLKYNGTAWEVFDGNEQPGEPDEPEIPDVPVEHVAVNFSAIHRDWNNFDYVDQGYYCTYVIFDGEISGGGLDGDFSDLLAKMTLNGEAVDTENVSVICAAWIGANGGFVLRFKTLPNEKSSLVLPAGATFTVGGGDTNVYEIKETVSLTLRNGQWCQPLPTAEFISVNYWNNNIISAAGTRFSILDFNVENLGSAINANKSATAMAGITLNGVKLADIDGASVSYANGANHLTVDLPMTSIYPTAEYPITILKVQEGTVFENYELPEITLSLIGGSWMEGEYELMPESQDYATISDVIGENQATVGAEGLLAAMEGFAGDVDFKFVYRSNEAIVNYSPFGGLAIYLNSTNSWDGWRFFFIANKVYVYDATMGGVGDEHVLIGECDFGIANNFEMQMEISVKETDGKYTIVVGGSGAKLLEINDITPKGNCIGGGISLYSAARSCIVKDYKKGDIFDPILTIYSKQELVLQEGDDVPVIDAEAIDGLTEITPTYVWDEGAITDGKMNAGIWNCVVTATDANGNYVSKTVRVTVKGEVRYAVTFDGKNEAYYAYGEKIAKPADPTKDSTAKYQYTFDGWYVDGVKWDFENDVVTADVALTAKFIENDVYYKVTVTVAGEDTQVLYVTYGAQVDLSVFDKEGLVREVKKDGKAITSLIVTEDTAIEISYSEKKADKQESNGKGCASSFVGGSAVVTLLTVIGGGIMLSKGRKSDEEEN